MNNTFGESDGEGEEEGGEVVVYDQEEGEDDGGSGYEEDDGTEGGGESAEEEAGGEGGPGQDPEQPGAEGDPEDMETCAAALAVMAGEGAATPEAVEGAADGTAAAEVPAVPSGGGGTGENAAGADGLEDEEYLEEDLEDKLDESLKPSPLYHAVKSLLGGAMEPRKLNKRMKLAKGDCGFCLPGDER